MPPRIILFSTVIAAIASCSSDSGGNDAASETLGSCQPACTSIDDCPTNAVDCLDDGRCVKCTADEHCQSPLKCNVAIGECTGCVLDEDCGESFFGCDAKVCVYCKQDTDCMTKGGTIVGTGKCNEAGACEKCDTEIDCLKGTAFKYCVEHQCKGCKTDEDCIELGVILAVNTKRCDTKSGHCIGCASDDDCAVADAFPTNLRGKHVCK